MKFAKRTGFAIVLLGCSYGMTATAADDGWYAVANGGQSKYDVGSKASVDSDFNAVLAEFDLALVGGTSSLDDSDAALGLTLGYQVTENFAAELSYVDLGSLSYSATVTDGVTDADFDAKVSADGPTLAFLGILPIGGQFSAYGRVGLALLDTEASVRASVAGTAVSDSASTTRSNMMYGVGGEYGFSDRFGVRIEWNRYADVGSKDLTGEGDVDVFQAGFRFSF